jgi:gas vesicle protein
MSNRDGFTSGLVFGSVLGGLVGGVLGVVLSSRLSKEPSTRERSELNRQSDNSQESENIETARLSLEDKIAQLNQAIDDVRHQLNTVNGNAVVERPNQSFGNDG